MAREIGYTELDFLKAIPSDESEALSTKEIATKVGCSNALAFTKVSKLMKDERLLSGPPGHYGSATYYLAAPPSPETAMPKIKSGSGVYLAFDKVIRTLLKDPSVPAANRAQFTGWAVLELFNAAMNDIPQNKEDELSAVYQKVRAAVIEERKITQKYLGALDSILNDPYLNNDLTAAGGAMLNMSDGIDKQILNDLVNEYRKAVL